MGYRQPGPHTQHIVQLFDAARSCADAAAAFLADGWEAGEHLLVLAKSSRWERIADYLEHRGCAARDSSATARLRVVEAAAVLRRMRRRGVFMRDAPHQVISELLEQVAPPTAPLRVYGEVVELLAEEGSYGEACAVEDAWNQVLAVRPVRLLCGYSAAHFIDPRQGEWLRQICGRHDHVRTHSADTLGSWLTAQISE